VVPQNSRQNFCEILRFCSDGCKELGRRNTLMESELREMAGVSRKIAGKWRDGGGSAPKSGNGSEEGLGGVCIEWKMDKNGSGLAGFRPVELRKIRF
jgi:hypothetical protein